MLTESPWTWAKHPNGQLEHQFLLQVSWPYHFLLQTTWSRWMCSAPSHLRAEGGSMVNDRGSQLKTWIQVSAWMGLQAYVSQPVSVCVCPTKSKPKTSNKSWNKQPNQPKFVLRCIASRRVASVVGSAKFAGNEKRISRRFILTK